MPSPPSHLPAPADSEHPLADVTCKDLAATTIAPLSPSPQPTLHYIIAGKGHWQDATRRIPLHTGDLLLLPPTHTGGSLHASATTALRLQTLLIPPAFLHDPTGATQCWTTPRGLRRCRLATEYASVLRDCLFEKLQGRPAWQSYVTARARLFLVQFHRLLLSNQPASAAATPSGSQAGRIKVLQYLRGLDAASSLHETLESVATSLGLSPRRFTDLFRELTGTTWLKHLHSQKVLHAKRLLAAKRDSVGMIAFQAGFEDVTTFHRVFKNHVGTTPQRWREEASALFALNG